ncbi:DoxX family protein [Acidobacteria bacterium AB60]|nr:DoxX family protein [Acidobacteria bacterium AB60]
MHDILNRVRLWYGRAATGLNYLQSPLLLAIRLYWGWQFMQDGWGKLTHLSKVAEFFGSLALPMPAATAFAVGMIELAGGFLFTFGIASRLVSLVLFLNMTMAYLSVPDDRTNLSHMFSKPEDFYGATPYTYWFAALLILILGPGAVAVDWILARNWRAAAVAEESASTSLR